jgi:phosphate starvation-inducible PhoH-like protein
VSDPSGVVRSPAVPTDDSTLPLRLTLAFPQPEALRELVGELGQNLKIVGRCLGVRVQQRADTLVVGGQDGSITLAADVLEQLYAVALAGHPLHGADVDQACRMISADPSVRLAELVQETIAVPGARKRIHPRSPRQRAYLQSVRTHDLTFGIGPAGTGKTYLAMAMAVSALFRDEVRRIVLCRPAVEAGEKLGYLPGDLAEKVNPYLRPLYDALNDLAGFDRAEKLVQKGVIEVAPLAFMRGRTLSESFVILDEAQNTTPEQMKMFLTRLGLGSRVVVTGDVTQIDLPVHQRSGLVDALHILDGVDGVAICGFDEADIVRHPLVSSIVKAYDRAAAAMPPRASRPRREGPPRGPGPESGP